MKTAEMILKEAGYYQGRNVDISQTMDMYSKYGYHINDVQKRIITEYAYLIVSYMHPFWKQEIIIWFNPVEAQKAITMEVVELYNSYFNDEWAIIGDIEKENMTIFISKDGVYYTAFDDYIIEWGSDILKMIDKLIKGECGNTYIIE